MQFLAERALNNWWYLYKSFLQLHSFTPAAHIGCPPGAGLACAVGREGMNQTQFLEELTVWKEGKK